MSDKNDFGGWVIALCVIGAFYLWSPDWNLFNWTNKTERWLDVKRKDGKFSKGLDENWAYSTVERLSVKGKIRKSLNKDNDDYDFAYKVNYKLTKPKTNNDDKVVTSYELDMKFIFIDDDGFIIHEYTPFTLFSLEHEKYENKITWTEKEYPYDTEVSSQALHKNIIPEGIVSRVSKVIYIPTIRAEIVEKENEYSSFGFITEEEIEDPFEKRLCYKTIKQ